MRHPLTHVLLGGVLASALGLGLAHAAEPVSIENLARQPAVRSLTMSPDGQHLVGLIPSPANPDETALATWDTDSLSSGPTVVTPSGDHMKFISAVALKAGKILAVTRQEWTGQLGGCGEGKVTGATKTFVSKVHLTGMKQKEFEEAFTSDKTVHLGKSMNRRMQTCRMLMTTAGLVETLPLDPTDVIIRRLSRSGMASDYYRYNLKTGEAKRIVRGGGKTSPALFDPRTGKLLVKSEIEAVDGDYEHRFLILNPKTGEFEVQKPLTTRLSNRYQMSVVGIDHDSGKYYVLTNQFSDKVQARLYDPSTHKFDPQPVVADKNYSITALLFSQRPKNFNQVIGFVVGGPHAQTVYVAPILRGIQAGLKKAYPDQRVDISSYTDDFSKLLFTTSNASHPPTYHLLLDKKKVVDLGGRRPWIQSDRIGEQRWVTYEARDGLEIPAILDLPAEWDKGDAPIPAVIMPHGGPWARDWMGWDRSGWVPLLTSRGYAVLRPQYRGSAGLGRKLWLAGDAQWGLKMSDDLDDGAAWLIEKGITEKGDIAIFGYSYGGFAAVAATVRSPSPYECAIAGAPVADLGRLGTSWSNNRIQRITQGWTVKGMDPMQNVDKAHLPIMLFDGTRDVRTPPAIHAVPFYEAVKDKVDAEFHWIPDMPHSMPWYPRQKRKVLNLIVNYLANECGLAEAGTDAAAKATPAKADSDKTSSDETESA